ncbi:putative integral membrane protein [Aspergillus mulundensis]|uniref:Putative p-type ATPase n=1 Tax=Aspergillus mulundensis TaxID=1810919 RepID=A0A3D8SKR1_9EURO|nr:putative p-type ATPase [Aspergillus mulundensis]RDW86917.1 putative p-type ATPase [Aspergillus mulundensis]
MFPLEGRSLSIFVVTLIFLILSFLSVALRCFVRLRLVRAFGWDDSLMVLAMALNILFALCGMIGARYGLGRKMKDFLELPDYAHEFETALFWWWLGQTSYVITCVAAKVSIALALLRLTVTKAHKIILWGVIGVSIVVGLVFWLMLMLQCKPVDYFWHRLTSTGTCLNTDHILNIAYVYSVIATICDFILGLLPIALVWKLHMNQTTKAALAGILSMGCVASAAVIVRIPYLHYYKDKDFLYATTNISIWSNVEAGLGITAGSLVTLRPLLRWFRGETSYVNSKSRTWYGGTGSMPLSSMNGARQSRQDQPGRHWRPDIESQNSHGVVTTVHGSPNSSRENLNPNQNSLAGVNVQKSFLVTTTRIILIAICE